jgi:uncharacterized membrane protein YhaH (DUF805 family)
MSNSEQGFLKTTGRISRVSFLARYFWFSGLFNFLFAGLIYASNNHAASFINILLTIVQIVLGVAVFIQAVKRAHDIGKSGWFLLIPFYNLIVFFQRGDDETNKYGSPTNHSKQFNSNIIYDNDNSDKKMVVTLAWLGSLFYIISILFVFWIARPQIQSLDTDGDGVMNIQDLCPEIPGVTEHNGCPPNITNSEMVDTDNDGIEDSKDLCPSVAGTASNNGCPEIDKDQDQDGVIDKFDNCPTKFGLKTNSGCPETKIVRGNSLSNLRAVIINGLKDVNLDLTSVSLNTPDYSLTYITGRSYYKSFTLIYDPSKKELQRRINENIIPKNKDKNIKILVDAKYSANDDVYCTLIGFQK